MCGVADTSSPSDLHSRSCVPLCSSADLLHRLSSAAVSAVSPRRLVRVEHLARAEHTQRIAPHAFGVAARHRLSAAHDALLVVESIRSARDAGDSPCDPSRRVARVRQSARVDAASRDGGVSTAAENDEHGERTSRTHTAEPGEYRRSEDDHAIQPRAAATTGSERGSDRRSAHRTK